MKKKIYAVLAVWLAVFVLLPGMAWAALTDYDVPDANEWYFYTLDDEEINQNSFDDKVQLLVFYRSSGCSNSLNTIRQLAASEWARDERIQIIAIEVDGADKAVIQQFKNSNAADCGNMLLVYNESYGYSNRVWSDYANDLEIYSGSLAFNFVLADGKIRYAWTGNYSAANCQAAFNALLNGIPEVPSQPGDETLPEGDYQLKISGNENYTEAYEVLAQLNAHRAANNLPALTMDKDLLDSAMQRAAECAVYYSHTRPDGRICTTIIPGNLNKAENIAIGYSSASAVMAGWKSSSGHNANMLHDKMTAVGIGCFEYNGVKHWVQLFSSAEPQAVTPVSGSLAATHDILAVPEYLKLQAAPTAITLLQGETATVRLNNTNLEYSYKTGVVQATYAKADNENVASAVLAGEQVQIKGLAAGVTTVRLGAAAVKEGAEPFTVTVQVTVAADGGEETPTETVKLTLNSDQGNIAASGQAVMQIDVTKGQAYKLPSASKSGYSLQYWSDGKNNYKANTDYVVEHDTELLAIWQKNSSGSSGGSSGGSSSRPNTSQTNQTNQPEQTTQPEQSGTPGGSTGSSTTAAAAVAEVVSKFADVSQNDWYAESVAFVYKKGMMNGMQENEFAPNEKMTRAMLVTMLYRLEGVQGTDAAAEFADVPAGQWYSDAVSWAASAGLVNGVADGIFAPNDDIEREQLAVILYRYAQLKGYDVTATADLSAFTDGIRSADWAREPMQWAVGSGLIEGMGSDILAPQGNASRAQVATMLMRFCTNIMDMEW